METDWIALDYCSEMVEFDMSKHTANTTPPWTVLDRCPKGFDELGMFFPETCYTSHMIFWLQLNAITDGEIEFAVVAPKVCENDYFEIRQRY